MELKELEAAIEKKATERAEKRIRSFCQALQSAYQMFTGVNHTFVVPCGTYESEVETKQEIFNIIALAGQTQGGCYNLDPRKWPDWIMAKERDGVVKDILKATEAVRELAELKGEE